MKLLSPLLKNKQKKIVQIFITNLLYERKYGFLGKLSKYINTWTSLCSTAMYNFIKLKPSYLFASYGHDLEPELLTHVGQTSIMYLKTLASEYMYHDLLEFC